MLNQTGVTRETYGGDKNFLIDEANSTSVSCIVANDGVTADMNGDKIIKAGTPLYGDLTKRETAFKVSGAEGAIPVGIVRHDVDVTKGNANSQVTIFGTVDISKLDSDVVAKLTDTVKSALKMIQFVKL